jgi:hypothetical protein
MVSPWMPGMNSEMREMVRRAMATAKIELTGRIEVGLFMALNFRAKLINIYRKTIKIFKSSQDEQS